MGDDAAIDRNDVVRAMTSQSGVTRLVNRERHPGAPTEPRFVSGEWFDDDVTINASQSTKLLSNNAGL